MILITDPRSLQVMQGRVRFSEEPDDVLVAMLGSCVAACLRDPVLKIGGMNHFLLPGNAADAGKNSRYGAHSMEELVNGLLRKGAERHRLEIWLYGGADTLQGRTKIGSSNATFAEGFVRAEGFVLRGQDLGGTRGRRVRFHPHSGEVEVALMGEPPQQAAPAEKTLRNPVELF